MNAQEERFDGAELVPGIRVFDCTELSSGQRLDKSSGTTLAASSSYEKEARVPLKPWHPLRSDDPVCASRFASEFVSGNSIAVVRIPDELRRGIYAADPFQDWSSFEAELGRFAGQLSTNEHERVRLIGAHANKVGLTTTTWNRETSKYIGLHLDSFYGLPLEQRHLAPNRLCLNIGGEKRFFVFINLTLRQMHEILLLHRSAGTLLTWDVSSVGQVFMQRFPHYPAIRLVVRPGEAYIAPTENLIHDSTTEDKSTPDVAFTLLGAFAPCVH